jgi:ribosomal protein L37AE/L43A
MNNIETDQRGILITCPKCGRRNRLKYEGLGKIFRCGQCQSELQPPGEPVDVHSDLVDL